MLGYQQSYEHDHFKKAPLEIFKDQSSQFGVSQTFAQNNKPVKVWTSVVVEVVR